jgi:hypothetical protein
MPATQMAAPATNASAPTRTPTSARVRFPSSAERRLPSSPSVTAKPPKMIGALRKKAKIPTSPSGAATAATVAGRFVPPRDAPGPPSQKPEQRKCQDNDERSQNHGLAVEVPERDILVSHRLSEERAQQIAQWLSHRSKALSPKDPGSAPWGVDPTPACEKSSTLKRHSCTRLLLRRDDHAAPTVALNGAASSSSRGA